MPAVIKPGSVHAEAGTIIKSEDYEQLASATQLAQKAQELYEKLQLEREQELAKAKKLGHEQGLALAQQELFNRHLEVVSNSLSWIENLEEKLAKVVENTLREIIDEIAPQEVLLSMVKKALVNLQGQAKIKISARPSELEHVKNGLTNLDSKLSMQITYTSSADLGKNEVMFESPIGIIRLDLPTALDRFAQALTTKQQAETK